MLQKRYCPTVAYLLQRRSASERGIYRAGDGEESRQNADQRELPREKRGHAHAIVREGGVGLSGYGLLLQVVLFSQNMRRILTDTETDERDA